MENKKSLKENTFYYLIYNALNVIFPLATGIYVSRTILQSYVGEVAYAQNITQYFVVLAFLGIPTYGMREIAKVRGKQEKVNQVFSELFFINLISTIIFFVLYIITILFISEFRDNLLLYIITGSMIAFNAINISWLYEGLEEFGFISLRNIIFKMLSFLLLIIFVRNKNDYLIYAAITVFGTVGNYIVNMVYYPRYAKITTKNICLKKHMKSIMYLVAVNLAIEIYSLVDISMLGMIGTKNNVAIYSYSSKIQKMLLQIINSFTIVIVPRIALYYESNDFENFNVVISNTLKLLLLVSIPMIVGIYFVSEDLTVILYGLQYIKSAEVLKILCFLLFISPIGYLLGSRVMLVTGNERKMLLVVAIGAFVNVVGNYVFIQLFCENGAAIASVLSEFIVMIIYINFGKKYFKLQKLKRSIINIIFASLCMSICLIIIYVSIEYLYFRIILSIFCGAIIYFILLFLLKEELVYSTIQSLKKKLAKN